MKLIPALVATVILTGGAGVYAYAQQRATPVASQSQNQHSPTELERLRERVMDRDGTERAFDNAYWDNHEAGIYVEARTGEALFASSAKFDSGTGWPSFSRPIDANNITLREDNTVFGMRRTEVRSRQGNAHLGHVFDDGPRSEGGQRYCMNSIAMRFIPRAQMEAEGYGRYLPIVDARSRSRAR